MPQGEETEGGRNPPPLAVLGVGWHCCGSGAHGWADVAHTHEHARGDLPGCDEKQGHEGPGLRRPYQRACEARRCPSPPATRGTAYTGFKSCGKLDRWKSLCTVANPSMASEQQHLWSCRRVCPPDPGLPPQLPMISRYPGRAINSPSTPYNRPSWTSGRLLYR